jgi:RNA polymerase-associated protein LEO1
VQWSDGSFSLAIGDEFFDMNIEGLSQRQVFTEFSNFALYKGSIQKRIIVKPPESQRAQHIFISNINEDAHQGVKTNIVVGSFMKKESEKKSQREGGAGKKTKRVDTQFERVTESEQLKNLTNRGRRNIEEDSFGSAQSDDEEDEDFEEDEDLDDDDEEDSSSAPRKNQRTSAEQRKSDRREPNKRLKTAANSGVKESRLKRNTHLNEDDAAGD